MKVLPIGDRLAAFIANAQAIHGSKYDYSLAFLKFKNAKSVVDIICTAHGPFVQTPDQHLRKYNVTKHANTGGCPMCAYDSRKQTKRKTIDQFVIDAQKVHGSNYTYELVEYENTHTKVAIICSVHGPFHMTPKDHISGKQGCRLCSHRLHHSNKAIRWLCSIENAQNIQMIRIGVGNEYRIPNTRYHADGYHPETNTIYEFYGDRFHGNPRKFNPLSNCHPFNRTITAGELYKNTVAREDHLKALGYNLVTMWESDFVDVKPV